MNTASPGSQQNTDNEYLKLLSIFHYVAGGMRGLPPLCGLLAPIKRTVVGVLLSLCCCVVALPAEQPVKSTQVLEPPLSTEQIHALVTPLDSSMDQIQSLIDKAAAVGAETRYFKVSLAVLKRYRKEVFDMKLAKEPYVMHHTARWLLECAARTKQGLEDAIRHPQDTIHVPNIDLQKLEVREGCFLSGHHPVILAGLCGWASPKDFDYLSSIGCTVFAEEMGPTSVFPEEGKPHDINALTTVLDAAAQHNMKVDLLLSPHYIPQWAYDKWPDLDPENRRKINPFMPWDVRSPHLKEILSRFLDVLIPQVRDKSALLDYDLINEAWYRPFAHLDDTIVTNFMKTHPSVERADVPEQYTTEQVTEFTKWYAGEVRKRDARHPIYAKVLTSQEVLCVDREAFGDTLTANGMDSYPEYPDPTGVLAADFAWTLLRIDFHRSLTPGKPILDGEYHPCAGAYDMPDAYFRTAMWAPALHGKDSTALWVYGRVDEVSSDWHANGGEVLGHSALDFLRLAKEIHAFQRQRGSIAMYYGGYHDNYRSAGDPGNGIREAYLASLFQDSDIGMLTEKRVQSGALSHYKVIVLPAGCSPSPVVARRIEDFRKAGGAVVQCQPKTTAKDLWPIIHSAVASVDVKKLVSADQWGVECRSMRLGGRCIFYLINYKREPVDVELRSRWPLTAILELRTQTRSRGDRLHLEPLEFKLMEVRAK
jgi:hypothetical protein